MSYLPKIVMITGATGGLGTAFAHRFAAAGSSLILTSRHPDKLDALVKELKVPTHKIILDISKRVEIEKAMTALPTSFRQIDLLINNAGGALGLDPAYKADLDDWQTMIETNNLGLVVCTRLVLPGMVERNRGHIINIGSVAGNYQYPSGHVYCAVKAFTKQFSLALRSDLIATEVRVTNIEPGLVETDFSLNRFKGDATRADKVYSGANALQAADIAESVYWVATLPPRVSITSLEVMPTTQAPAALAVHRTN